MIKDLLDNVNKTNYKETFLKIISLDIKFITKRYIPEANEILDIEPEPEHIWCVCSHCWDSVEWEDDWNYSCEYCLDKYWEEDMHDDYHFNDCFEILIPEFEELYDLSNQDWMFYIPTYIWIWVNILYYLYNDNIDIKYLKKYINNIT